MKRRRAALVAALAALVAVATTVVLLRVGASPVERTVALGQGQYVGVSAVDALTGHVYVTVSDPSHNEMRVLDAASARWRTLARVPSGALSLAVPSGAGRVLLIRPSANGQETRVDVLDTVRGATLRTITVPLYPSYFNNVGAVSGGIMALASFGNQNCTGTGTGVPTCTLSGSGVALLDAATGRLRRALTVPGRAWATALDARAAHVLVTSDMAPGLGFSRLVVSVFDARTGRLLHRAALPTPNLRAGRMVVDAATGRAFLLGGVEPAPSQPRRSYLCVLDTRTGATVHALTWGGGAGDVAVDERTGRVFVTDTGPARLFQKSVAGGGSMGMFLPVGPGALHTLDAHTGALLQTATLGIAPGAIAVDERRDRVYVTDAGSHDGYGSSNGTPIDIPAPISGPGGVSVADAASGHTLRTMALGTQPSSIALDGRTGRAFIGDMGDGAPRPLPDSWGWLPVQVRQRLAFLPQHAQASRPVPGGVIVVDTTRL